MGELRSSGRVGATGPQAGAVNQCPAPPAAQFILPLLKLDGYEVPDCCVMAFQETLRAVGLI